MSEFPQYRKLTNSRAFYRIEDQFHFTEIQLIGKKSFELHFKATQYPEILKIKEMLACDEPYLISSVQEFENHKESN
jgi:hypothetical protein